MTPARSSRSALLAVLAVAVLGACASDERSPTTTNPAVSTATTTPAALANPASEYCVSRHGTVEIVNEVGGQVGYCNLPDGTRVEEWQYYRSQTGATTSP